jgi:hypothetical protein
MKKEEEGLQELIICACHNTEHQMIIGSVSGWDEIFVSFHLKKLPFLKRLVHGIKYIFGYKCRYGDFDEMLIRPEDAGKLEKAVEWLKGKHGEEGES